MFSDLLKLVILRCCFKTQVYIVKPIPIKKGQFYTNYTKNHSNKKEVKGDTLEGIGQKIWNSSIFE